MVVQQLTVDAIVAAVELAEGLQYFGCSFHIVDHRPGHIRLAERSLDYTGRMAVADSYHILVAGNPGHTVGIRIVGIAGSIGTRQPLAGMSKLQDGRMTAVADYSSSDSVSAVIGYRPVQRGHLPTSQAACST